MRSQVAQAQSSKIPLTMRWPGPDKVKEQEAMTGSMSGKEKHDAEHRQGSLPFRLDSCGLLRSWRPQVVDLVAPLNHDAILILAREYSRGYSSLSSHSYQTFVIAKAIELPGNSQKKREFEIHRCVWTAHTEQDNRLSVSFDSSFDVWGNEPECQHESSVAAGIEYIRGFHHAFSSRHDVDRLKAQIDQSDRSLRAVPILHTSLGSQVIPLSWLMFENACWKPSEEVDRGDPRSARIAFISYRTSQNFNIQGTCMIQSPHKKKKRNDKEFFSCIWHSCWFFFPSNNRQQSKSYHRQHHHHTTKKLMKECARTEVRTRTKKLWCRQPCSSKFTI